MGHGDGTWRRRGAGWEFRFTVINPATGLGVQRSVSGPTKEACRLRRDELTQLANTERRSVTVSKKSTSLAAWIDEWVRDYLPVKVKADALTSTTAAGYRTHLTTSVRDSELGATRLRALTPLQIETSIAGLPGSVSKKRGVFAALSLCLKDAVKAGKLDASPMLAAQRPSRRGEQVKAQSRALDSAEVERLLESTTGTMRVAVDLLRSLGLRKGELIALRYEDIDLDRLVVHVHQQRTNDGVERAPKTASGTRRVPLPKHLVEVLLDHRAAEEQRLALLDDPQPEYVLLNNAGHQFDARGFSRRYRSAARKAKVHDTGAHALRHHYGSALLRDGVPVVRVSRWMGHASPDVTLRVYASVIDEVEAVSADEVSATFSR